jgi:hypothetical protein
MDKQKTKNKNQSENKINDESFECLKVKFVFKTLIYKTFFEKISAFQF